MPQAASAIFPSAKRIVTVVIMANLFYGCWQSNSKGLANIQLFTPISPFGHSR
jgi:hypothetical protein